MKFKDIAPWVVVGFLLSSLVGGVIYTIIESQRFNKEVNTKQYWEINGFVTAVDSIMADKYDDINPINKTFSVTVPEKVVERYIGEEAPANRELAILADSLIRVNDSLNTTIAEINQSFITTYPFNPKIIRGLFTSDTLKLDLLNTDGTISSHLWITDYERYKYGWTNGTLTTSRLERLKRSKKFVRNLSHNLYTHAGYDFPLQAGYIQGDYYLSWRQITIATHLGVTIEKAPRLQCRVGIGYKPF